MEYLIDYNKAAIAWTLSTTLKDLLGVRYYILDFLEKLLSDYQRARDFWYADSRHPLNFVGVVRVSTPKDAKVLVELRLW